MKDDDQHAFPTEGREVFYYGMTLRDYFAAKAMQGMVSSITDEDGYDRFRAHAAAQGLSVSQWIARDSYKQADAMLEARK